MTAIVVAAGAAAAVLVIVVVVLATRRAQHAADERVESALAGVNSRIEAMVRELGDALERVQEEDRRSRLLGDLVGTIDLDEVLARTLETASALEGVDAALASLSLEDGQPLVATLGLSPEEAQRQAIAGPPDGREARSIGISYRYAPGQDVNGAVHSGLAVPLRGDDGVIGYLVVFTRSPARTFEEDDVRHLEEIAVRATPAIENARRFREVRELADHDALTGLCNARFFHETLEREVARAHRYRRHLALLVLDLDDFKQVNDRFGHLAGNEVLADIGRRIMDVVRSADVACRIGGEEFAVVLPESTRTDAEQLYARLQASLATRVRSNVGELTVSAGAAELRPDEDATSLFQRADDALYRAKAAGKARVTAATDDRA